MKKYLLKRISHLLIVIIGASFLTFLMTYLAPSDPAEMKFAAYNVVPTDQMLEEAREEMGLDRPFIVQYADWLKDLLQGDLGYSYSRDMPVSDMIGNRIGMTVYLAVVSLTIIFVLSLILGILAALKKGSIIDLTISFLSAMSISVPSFWLGLILIYWFVVKLGMFKITELEAFKGVVLPAFTLAIPLVGRYAKQIRGAILDEINNEYVTGAKARGIKGHRILFNHIIPNTFFSIVTLFGMTIAALLGGTAIVESIFSWPGLGLMALEAITNRDYILLQSYVLLMSFIYVSINLVVDVAMHMIDPRIDLLSEGDANE